MSLCSRKTGEWSLAMRYVGNITKEESLFYFVKDTVINDFNEDDTVEIVLNVLVH